MMTKCKICRAEFIKRGMKHKLCGKLECGLAWNDIEQAKKLKKKQMADRKEKKLKLDKLKTRSDYIKETQIAFNSYIRERDKAKPCICCGVPLYSENPSAASTGGAFDCGHYRSIGSAPHLRFDERNAHGQRKQCNRYGAGRAVDYRIGLIARIGADEVERLENDNAPAKWTIPELIEMKKKFQQMKKELEND